MKRQRYLSPAPLMGLLLLIILACAVPTPPPVTPPVTPPSTPTPLTSPLEPPPLRPEARLDAAIALTEAPVSAPFILHFSQPMDTDAAGPPLNFEPEVAGRFFWDDTATTLLFIPHAGFAPGTRYIIRLNPALRSAEGHALVSVPLWTLETRSAPQAVQLQAFNRTDADGLQAQPLSHALRSRRPVLRVTFDRPMDRESVVAALRIEPRVPFSATWDEDGALLLEPDASLELDTRYTVSLSDRARDIDGTPIQRAQQWTVRTAPLVARFSAPSATRDASIAITFNYPVAPNSLTQAARIEPAVAGDWEWNDRHTQATFTPEDALPTYTDFVINFGAGLRDARGDRLPPPDPLTFTTPPPLLSHGPRGNSEHPGSAIQLTFDRPMDQAATEAAIRITPPITPTFSWEETTLIIQPESGYLAAWRDYDVTIETGARGADGAALFPQPFSWQFTTGEFRRVASFGSGPNAQVLDADGRRAVQCVISHDRITVTFELYSLTLDQFLDRYASGFRGVAGHEMRPISTEGATLIREWATEFVGAVGQAHPASAKSAKLILPELAQMDVGAGFAQYSHQSIHDVIIPEDVPPGMYILNMRTRLLSDQLILVVTRNTLMVKQAEGQLVAWITDIPAPDGSGGEPVPNVEVGVYARDGARLAQGRADARGVFRAEVDTDPQPLIVVARQGDDVTVSGLSNEWRTGYDPWWGWWRPMPTARTVAAHIYTDRPIYRPGHTVYFKAVVRQDNDAVYSLPPAGTPVTARIRDARNNVVQTFALETNAFGAVDGEFAIAEGAMVGDYAVEIVVAEESHRQTFKVEEYRKPDYEVTVTTDQPAFVDGDTVTVTVDTAYYFGEPVPHATVEIRRLRVGWRYSLWDSDPDDLTWFKDHDILRRGRTDADGRFTFTFQAEIGDYARGIYWNAPIRQATWGIEATVDDGSHQTVSGFTTLSVYDAAEVLRVETDRYLYPPGEAFDVVATLHDLHDAPVAGRELEVALLRWSPRSGEYDNVIQTFEATTGADGRAVTRMSIAEPGYYHLRVSGEDSAGRPLTYERGIYAFRRSGWDGEPPSGELDIRADRAEYAPGDVAQLLIQSDFDGPALLTFERGTTRREQPVELTAPVTLVDVPLLDDDAPNIHVVVNAWRLLDAADSGRRYQSTPDGQLLSASVNLDVSAARRRLSVSITPDRERYAPRDEATFTLRVTDAEGQPVQAEVSLALVDEAIFALSANLAPPIFDTFYAPRENLVRTYNALALRRLLLTNGMGGGGGDGGLEGSPRRDFPDTAAWLPALQTDADGEVSVTLTLPDSLTSWRLTAIAATADTRVGEATHNVITHQPVIARPILPRFLTVGDEAALSVMLHNYADETQTLTVTLAVSPTDGLAGELTLAAPRVHTLTLEPGEQRIVGWTATAEAAGPVYLLTQARVEGVLLDAVQLPLTLLPLAVPDVTTEVGTFTGDYVATLTLPAEALGLSTVRVELSRSIAGTLLEGLDYLTGFPYGCVEQTMSKALPNAVVGRAIHALGVSNPALQADLPPKINASVQRLYGYQHNDGGWGWWYDDSTDAYQTAWVVFGLATTAEAGYEVDPDVIARGVGWLNDHLGQMDARTRAYALYSMAVAGSPHVTATLALADDLAALDTFSQAGLALALHAAGEDAAAERVVAHLAETATEQQGYVHWRGATQDGYYAQKTMASDTRSTAQALSALTRIEPEHPLIPGIVRWLMGQRRASGWGTTNETAYSIIALTDHLLATSFSEAAASTAYSVTLNGAVLTEGALGRGEPAVVLEIPRSQLRAGANDLRLEHDGGNPLYYVISQRVYLAQAEIDAAGDIEVTRAYRDPATGDAVDVVAPGELVEVQLRVRMPEQASYIIVEDRLPGGLEPLNERLNTTSHVASGQEPVYYWREYGYNYKEIRDDRVSFFITEFPAGERVFTYLARATHAGDFVALPVEVTAMYDATVWGRSASGALRVAE